jgi:hypothetical protein
MTGLMALSRAEVALRPKVFYLLRTEDESGVSGTGRVADGVQFSDGQCVLKWNVIGRGLGIYTDIDQVLHVHGHNGRTKVVWL